jgi:hypothetical protein
MDIPGHGTVHDEGSWDLRGRFEDYTNRVPVAGKTFLDVGCASGFLSFEAEKRGAIVTSFDLDRIDDSNPLADVPGETALLNKLKNGYRLAHSRLHSNAKTVYGSVFDLPKLIFPPSQITLLGQILVHLSDPLSAIRQASLVTYETLIITEGSFENDDPIARFKGALFPGTRSFWHLSTGLYRQWLGVLEFDIESITKSLYRCNHAAMAGDSEIWTIVAKRRR